MATSKGNPSHPVQYLNTKASSQKRHDRRLGSSQPSLVLLGRLPYVAGPGNRDPSGTPPMLMVWNAEFRVVPRSTIMDPYCSLSALMTQISSIALGVILGQLLTDYYT